MAAEVLKTPIPGSLAPAATAIRWRRLDDWAGAQRYQGAVADGLLVALVSRDLVADEARPVWHLSVSFRSHRGALTRCPTWDELKSAKYQLVPDDVVMVLIFPRKTATYVDLHPTTLHLWQDFRALDL